MGTVCSWFLSGTVRAEVQPPVALPAVTQRVYLDFAEETAGGEGPPVSLGRVVIGLYGEQAGGSVALFLRAVAAPSGYRGSTISGLHPGYILGGLDALLPSDFPSANADVVSARAFELSHARPGTVSLVLNSTSEEGKLPRGAFAGYRITTGPAPAPFLDGHGIVIGRVLDGFEALAAIAAAPTFEPPANSPLLAYNMLASQFGDARGASARVAWSKPRSRIIVTDCGLLGGS